MRMPISGLQHVALPVAGYLDADQAGGGRHGPAGGPSDVCGARISSNCLASTVVRFIPRWLFGSSGGFVRYVICRPWSGPAASAWRARVPQPLGWSWADSDAVQDSMRRGPPWRSRSHGDAGRARRFHRPGGRPRRRRRAGRDNSPASGRATLPPSPVPDCRSHVRDHVRLGAGRCSLRRSPKCGGGAWPGHRLDMPRSACAPMLGHLHSQGRRTGWEYSLPIGLRSLMEQPPRFTGFLPDGDKLVHVDLGITTGTVGPTRTQED